MIKIEKGIPQPKMSGEFSSAFSNMEVGDSFFMSGESPNIQKRLSVNAIAWSKYHHDGKIKFSVRKQDGGYRIWRIK